MTFSASGSERAHRCPASCALPQHHTASVYADKGNDGHDVLCKYVKSRREGAEYTPPTQWAGLCDSIEDLAPGLRPELAMALNVATGESRILGEDIGREYQLDAMEIAGTADLVGVTDNDLVVIDLKTGWGDVPPPARNRQLRTLALMACRAFDRPSARLAIMRFREDDEEPRWEWGEIDDLDLEDIADELSSTYRRVSLAVTKVQRGDVPDVSEGSWCRYCPAKTSCPAKVGLALQVASGKLLDGPESLLPLTPERAGMVWGRLKAAELILKHLNVAVRTVLDEHGEIPLPGNRTLRLVPVNGRERIDGQVLWSVVAEQFGREVADRCVTRQATKSRLSEVMKELHGRGGAAKQREVLELVGELGGLSRSAPYMQPKEVEGDQS